jgi:hypothetical protein
MTRLLFAALLSMIGSNAVAHGHPTSQLLHNYPRWCMLSRPDLYGIATKTQCLNRDGSKVVRKLDY